MLSADYLPNSSDPDLAGQVFFRKNVNFQIILSADYLPNSLDQTQIRSNKKNVDLGDLQPQGAMGPDVVCDCAISCTYLFVRQILILEIINLPFAFSH